MDHKTGIPDDPKKARSKGRRRRPGKVITWSIFGCMIIGSLFAFGWIHERHICAEMPNGFLIGHAVVLPSLTGDSTRLVIRHPDGRMFFRHNIVLDYWDEEGFGGRFNYAYVVGDTYYTGGFIYLNETGLLSRIWQPDLYSINWRKIHPEQNGAHEFVDLDVVYSKLKNEGQLKYWCKMDWYLPDEGLLWDIKKNVSYFVLFVLRAFYILGFYLYLLVNSIFK